MTTSPWFRPAKGTQTKDIQTPEKTPPGFEFVCDVCKVKKKNHPDPKRWVTVIDVKVTDLCGDCRLKFTWRPEQWDYNPRARIYVSKRRVDWRALQA